MMVPLQTMVNAINSSFAVLFWCVILFIFLMTVPAIVVSQLLQPSIRTSRDETQREELFQHWGTFTRSFITVFEITLANWGPRCRTLMEYVSERWAIFFIGYKCAVGFAVVQIVISTFIQQTFKAASKNEEIAIAEKRAASQAMMSTLGRLFEQIDESGDGMITEEEFKSVLNNDRVRAWFAAIDIDTSEIESLFKILDQGDGEVDKDAFISVAKAIKGPATRQDVYVLKHDMQRVVRLLSGPGRPKMERVGTFMV